eukprot:3153768-Rhodomonas_salina.1
MGRYPRNSSPGDWHTVVVTAQGFQAALYGALSCNFEPRCSFWSRRFPGAPQYPGTRVPGYPVPCP